MNQPIIYEDRCSKCGEPCGIRKYRTWNPEPRPMGKMVGPTRRRSSCCGAPPVAAPVAKAGT